MDLLKRTDLFAGKVQQKMKERHSEKGNKKYQRDMNWLALYIAAKFFEKVSFSFEFDKRERERKRPRANERVLSLARALQKS